MYILQYQSNERRAQYCVMGIFFTKKQAKRARDCLIKYDQTRYPACPYRSEQDKKAYKVERHKLFKVKKHKDPFEGK